MSMRDYENLKDITIPPEQEAIMNIFCETWEECRESACTNCSDRPKKFMSLMECFSLKYSKKLMEAGYARVVRCKDCMIGFRKFVKGKEVIECRRYRYDDPRQYKKLDDYCSYGERKEE